MSLSTMIDAGKGLRRRFVAISCSGLDRMEKEMPTRSLKSMSIDALFELRNAVTSALTRRAAALKKELAALGADYAEVGRIAVYGKRRARSLKGRKVPIKYRDKAGNTWAGRGAQPRWLTAAIKAGAKREDFLIDKSAAAGKRSAAKKKRRGVKRSRRKK